jgi:ribonuclease HII
MVDNFVIDEINIRQANREAMRRALVEILRKVDAKKIEGVEIDGNDNYTFEELKKQPKFIV